MCRPSTNGLPVFNVSRKVGPPFDFRFVFEQEFRSAVMKTTSLPPPHVYLMSPRGKNGHKMNNFFNSPNLI